MKEAEKSLKKRKLRNSVNKKLIIIISIILILIIITLSIIFLMFYKQEKKQLNSSEGIESFLLEDDLKNIYIKLNPDLTANLMNNPNISSLKFVFKDNEGKTYYSEQKEILDEINFPKKKFGVLESTAESYNYKLNLEEIKDLEDFGNIMNISIVLIYKSFNKTVFNANITNQTSPKPKPKPIVKKDTSSGDKQTTTPVTCTTGAWIDSNEYRCVSNQRETRQTRTTCPSGIEETWTSRNCDEGYVCYDGDNTPNDKCIKQNTTCNDSDSGINYNAFGFLNLSSQTFDDLCLENNTGDDILTEYYCYFNGTDYEARNQTYNCTLGCLDNHCFFCTDNDNDGYNVSADVCGILDCNDSDSNINPNTFENCFNNIDENCDGNAPDCFEFGRISYWMFNDDLSDLTAENENPLYNGNCIADNCPLFNSEGGINNSGFYVFNGNNYLSVPLTPTPNDSILNNRTFSVSFWLNRTDNQGSEEMIIYSNAGSITTGILSIWYDRNTDEIFVYNNYGASMQTGRDSFDFSKWNYIVLTYDYDNRNIKLYLNGNLKTSDNEFLQIPAATSFYIGSKINEKYLNGFLDDVIIYNRILTSGEITDVYNSNVQAELPSMSLFERIISWFKRLFGF